MNLSEVGLPTVLAEKQRTFEMKLRINNYKKEGEENYLWFIFNSEWNNIPFLFFSFTIFFLSYYFLSHLNCFNLLDSIYQLNPLKF